ncbi:MAG: tetraacyldisaccharide 4'-kinase [Pseudomonadota bacterium]
MKTPAFWYAPSPHNSLARLLSPLAALYAHMARLDKSRYTPKSVTAPVICIGNIIAGGSGKTPCAITLMKLLKDSKTFLSPAFVTRGYKGKVEGPERVDDTNSPTFWGDEALLLCRHAPTYVAQNRLAGAELAIFNGADAVLLDDGLQHYSLQKDISFCVIDCMMGFGNGKVIPAGPLRQTLSDAWPAIDAFLLIGDDIHNIRAQLPLSKPVFTGTLKACEPLELSNTPYIAFCGIGFPDKFKKTLSENGIELAGWHPFADHHAYTMDDMTRLVDEAINNKARLITTEKDFVRLPDFHQKSLIDVLPIEIHFDEPQNIIDFIRSKLAAHSS